MKNRWFLILWDILIINVVHLVKFARQCKGIRLGGPRSMRVKWMVQLTNWKWSYWNFKLPRHVKKGDECALFLITSAGISLNKRSNRQTGEITKFHLLGLFHWTTTFHGRDSPPAGNFLSRMKRENPVKEGGRDANNALSQDRGN